VPLGSYSTATLSELTDADLDQMLTLDETLFIEHKSSIGTPRDCFKLRQTVASFANTAGGWILVGVSGGSVTANAQSPWVGAGAPALADLVRERLLNQIDPLPPFECRVMDGYTGGPVGVIRVYESSDTPHVLREGVVCVREPAGVRKLAHSVGSGPETVRIYEAIEIKSRAELIELVSRGRVAEERMGALMERSIRFPLVQATGLADALSHAVGDQALVVARMAPYTLSPRFRQWAASADAAVVVREAAEDLADTHGLGSGWVRPDPAGVAVLDVPLSHPPHCGAYQSLEAQARVIVDGAGIAAAAIRLQAPDVQRGVLRERRTADALANDVIGPSLRAAAAILEAGEFVGRCRCNIDLIGLPNALLLEGQGDRDHGAPWLPFETDVTLRMSKEDLALVACNVAYAYGRSARLPHWHRRS
jgi:hypothetical protein